MSDLASQSLGINKLSLWERRQQYESWLASGRHAPKPIPHLHTGVAQTRVDDVEPTKEHKVPEVGTINPLSPGAVVRTDQGEGDANPSDAVRLGLAKVLLSKAEGTDPATAERLANATSALLMPITRADDDKGGKDENLKNTVINQGKVKKGSSPGAATAKDGDEDEPDKDKARKIKDDDDDDDDEDDTPTIREVMDALGKLNKRLDNIEAKKSDDDDDDDADGSEADPTTGPPRGKGEGTPKALAADSEIANHKNAQRWRDKMDQIGEVLCRPDTADLFTTFQARADRAYAFFGQQAERPLHGEKLINYRRRLLEPLKKHSRLFKLADLRVVAVDPASFKAAEDDIYSCAESEAKNPTSVPVGFLREVKEERGGHVYTKFYGKPIAWMSHFMVPGKRVKRIIERSDSGNSRVVYERN
jgi:hypothetical protein